MLLDGGSGANFHESSDWWIYSGELRRPRATSLRGACSCGWRGETSYPHSWEDVDRNAPHLYDIRQLKDDWARHIDDVEARAVPVPDVLVALLDQVEQELDRLIGDAPLAALRAISRLEPEFQTSRRPRPRTPPPASAMTCSAPDSGCPSTKAADAYSATLCAR
ncbi:hypothetical protein ASD97_34210 [Streptomyces sp. Root63]|uniref:hypothetical protein n=1 Tax=unclassified Streptomyces TaxID=2593676 RepID=UPI00067DEFC8|nr:MULTISPECIES: hypothetical protein [unclassified Streptomyces]KQX44488.1 hypothetical protein ASD29_00240 [Streptomyces sp. Root1295]KRA47962.1 hypothetical protein ASD97_34210 [Streptomyces sp. Root63]